MNIRSYLLTGLAIGLLAAPAAAQDQTATTTAAAVGTSGQQQPPPPIAPAPEPLIKPSYWTANAGFETDTHNTGYGFIGPQYVKPFASNMSWVANANANYLYYEYPLGGGINRVTAPGLTAHGGVLFGDRNYLQVAAGPSYRRIRLENRDAFGTPFGTSSDNRYGVDLDVDGNVDPTDHSNIYAIYDFNSTDNYNWARLAAKQQITNFNWSSSLAHFIGVEAIGQGNRDIHSTQIGAFWETAFVPAHVSLMVRGGWKRSTFPLGGPDQTGPWVAIGFWQRLR